MCITADVLKARIQTVGVEEHPLKMERGTTLRTRKYFPARQLITHSQPKIHSSGASSTLEAVEAHVVRSLDLNLGVRTRSPCLTAAWVPYFEDGKGVGRLICQIMR